MKPFIRTFTGLRFYVEDPEPHMIDLRDIVHANARLCRFNGHVRGWYSVLEHQVRVSELVARWGGTRVECLFALHHDSPEMVVGDLASPIKHGTGVREEFCALEDEIMRAVCSKFGLPFVEPKIVKDADLVMLATELRDLMNGTEDDCDLPDPLPECIEPWWHSFWGRLFPFWNAERRFIKRFKQLTGE
jgi:hypothetical protein